MTDRGVIFEDSLVRMFLSGEKTQHRIVIQNPEESNRLRCKGCCASESEWKIVFCGHPDDQSRCDLDWVPMSFNREAPHRVGDYIWVRETFNSTWGDDVIYRANGGSAVDAGYAAEPKWTPSSQMTRDHSRLTLEITGARLHQIKDITPEDAIKDFGLRPNGIDPLVCYQILWDTLHPNNSWEDNPWVCALEFNIIEKNIYEVYEGVFGIPFRVTGEDNA